MSVFPSNRGIGRFEWSPGRVGPVVELLPDGTNVRQLELFAYIDPDGHRWEFPAHDATEESDGASIPRAGWSIIGAPLTGKYRAPALGHDHLYRKQPIDPSTGQPVTKAKADQLLLDMMRCAGVDERKAIEIYEGVHLAGQHSWDEDSAILHAQDLTRPA